MVHTCGSEINTALDGGRTHVTYFLSLIVGRETSRKLADMEVNTTYTLLIAEDEPDILQLLREYFEREGYEVLGARNGEEAIRLAEQDPDLVLLDVAMPKLDGLATCRRLRQHLTCPIVFLTARVDDADALEGFEAGADDYILKPFSLPVLGARVAAHLARESRQPVHAEVKFAGEITVDFRRKTLFVAGEAVSLTPREFAIVSLLARHAGRVFSRDQIQEKVAGWESESSSLGVTEMIRRIRKKLNEAGCEYDPLETVWGIGYRWKG